MKINKIIASKIAIGSLAVLSIGSIGAGIYIKGIKDSLYDQGTDYDYTIKDTNSNKIYEEFDLIGEELKYLALNEEFVIGDVSSYDYQNPMSDYLSEIMKFMESPVDGNNFEASKLAGSAYLSDESDYNTFTLQNPTLDTWLEEVETNEDFQNQIKEANYITVEFGTMDLINATTIGNEGREFMYTGEGNVGDFLEMFFTKNPYGIFEKDINELSSQIVSKYIELVNEIKLLSPGAMVVTSGVRHLNTTLYTEFSMFDKDNSKFSRDEYLYTIVSNINAEIDFRLKALDENNNIGAHLYADSNDMTGHIPNAISSLTLAQHREDFLILDAIKMFLRTGIGTILPEFSETGIAISEGQNEEDVYSEFLRTLTFPNDRFAYEKSTISNITDVIFPNLDFETSEKHITKESVNFVNEANEIFEAATSFDNQGNTKSILMGVDEDGTNILVDFSNEIRVLTQVIYYYDQLTAEQKERFVNNIINGTDFIEKEESAKKIFDVYEVEISSYTRFTIPNCGPGAASNDWKNFVIGKDVANNELLMEYIGY